MYHKKYPEFRCQYLLRKSTVNLPSGGILQCSVWRFSKTRPFSAFSSDLSREGRKRVGLRRVCQINYTLTAHVRALPSRLSSALSWRFSYSRDSDVLLQFTTWKQHLSRSSTMIRDGNDITPRHFQQTANSHGTGNEEEDQQCATKGGPEEPGRTGRGREVLPGGPYGISSRRTARNRGRLNRWASPRYIASMGGSVQIMIVSLRRRRDATFCARQYCLRQGNAHDSKMTVLLAPRGLLSEEWRGFGGRHCFAVAVAGIVATRSVVRNSGTFARLRVSLFNIGCQTGKTISQEHTMTIRDSPMSPSC